jgi:outer membrane protein OmpA-like peptidoglycan-associated protein
VGTGYTQGFGRIATGLGVPSVAGAGIGASVVLVYRATRHLSFGVEGQYQEFNPELNTSARGLAANLGATFHFAPTFRGDPWLRFGAGYRLVWENDPFAAPGTTPLRHGFEIANLKLGYDIRMSEDVAIAPVIGGDVTTFLWQDNGGVNNAYSNAQVASFVYAGLQGRFDIGGDRVGGPVARAEPPVQTTSVEAPPPAPAPAVAPPTSVTPGISVSEDIMKQCQLDLGAIDKAPKFDFDKSDLLPADYEALRQIAVCFTTGPMKGLGMTLVGRADPRGSEAYNFELGMKRANTVADYMETQGVSDRQIDAVSRGKLDATGTDDTTWSLDRRVDVLGRH